jgi:hypothetical protein
LTPTTPTARSAPKRSRTANVFRAIAWSGFFDSEPVDLSRVTLCRRVTAVRTALEPIGDKLRRQIVAATYLQTNDTPVTILEETASRKGRIWT